MKPKLLCLGMPPQLFEEAALVDQAARFCQQCPSQQACYKQGVAEHAKGQMWGGVWFNARGREVIPEQQKPRDPIRWIKHVDEGYTEMRLRLGQRPYGVPSRHDVWKIGTSCQNSSNRSGFRCFDPVCRTIRSGRDRMRKLEKADDSPSQRSA